MRFIDIKEDEPGMQFLNLDNVVAIARFGPNNIMFTLSNGEKIYGNFRNPEEFLRSLSQQSSLTP